MPKLFSNTLKNNDNEDEKRWFITTRQALIKTIILTGATATVSTLATVVGHPKTPTSAGNGGFNLGFPCLPSKLSINAYKKKIFSSFIS